MNLIERAKNIVVSPKTEWPVIDAEIDTVPGIYRNWLVFVAAVPAIAQFIGFSLVGMNLGIMNVRIPIGSGIVGMIVGYALTLALAYGLAWVVDALAPTFGGQKNFTSAFKLIAYGMAPALLAGILYIIPGLSVLVMLAALYSLYLVYLGLPMLMKCPADKSLVYTIAVAVCGLIGGIVLGVLTSCFVGSPMKHAMRGPGGEISIKTPQGEVKMDTARIDEMTRKLEEAGKRMEEAGKSADPQAPGKAIADVLAAATGQKARKSFAPDQLKALLPDSLGGLPRKSFETQAGGVAGVEGTTARAEYGSDAQRVNLEIVDVGALAALGAIAGMMNMTGEKETESRVEKTYKQGKRMIQESARKDGSSASLKMMLENGVMIDAQGHGMDLAAVRKIVEGLDLARLEAAN